VSDVGAFDTIGNVSEWVADWKEEAGFPCGMYGDDFGRDRACYGGAGDAGGLPYGRKKGGSWQSTSIAGVYMTIGNHANESDEWTGFRCARG
jgi:formylglycine-generating enzyme required for sulfatase activity